MVAFAARMTGTLLVAVAIVATTTVACARTATGATTVAAAELPQEARETLANLRAGARLPHERDGISFGNREKLLPVQPRGYYREYTVQTPGVKSRGARRIVCGGERRSPDACWYSGDHYRSFARIVE